MSIIPLVNSYILYRWQPIGISDIRARSCELCGETDVRAQFNLRIRGEYQRIRDSRIRDRAW